MIELNDMLASVGFDPGTKPVLIMRHTPPQKKVELELWRGALEDEHFYSAYQSQHDARKEKMLGQSGYLISCLGDGADALFIGVYRVVGFRKIKRSDWIKQEHISRYIELGDDGLKNREELLQFDLELTDILKELKGRLAFKFSGHSQYAQYLEKGRYQVKAIHSESRLEKPMLDWRNMIVDWDRLQTLPRAWRDELRRWRGIYYIFDRDRKLGYVGSACGADNLEGRWSNYRQSGHGGNKHLKDCRPENLTFSILERLSPDSPKEDVVPLENQWKSRLHTSYPYGLNDN